MRKNYLFNQETIAVYSNFSQGFEYAGVLQGEDNYFVRQSPRTIVQNSFLEVGKDLEGALKAARYHLRKKRNVPAALSVANNIILIQFKAACDLGGEIWIAAKHIESIQPHNKNQTRIHTINGHILTVDMKVCKAQAMRNLATVLYAILEKNMQEQSCPPQKEENGKGYLLIKENGQINYQIKKKKSD